MAFEGVLQCGLFAYHAGKTMTPTVIDRPKKQLWIAR